jgi:hypothetical protein
MAMLIAAHAKALEMAAAQVQDAAIFFWAGALKKVTAFQQPLRSTANNASC